MPIAARLTLVPLVSTMLGLTIPALAQTASPPPVTSPAATSTTAAAADVQAPAKPQAGFAFTLLGQTIRLGGTSVPPPYQGTAYTTFAGQPENSVDNVMARDDEQK